MERWAALGDQRAILPVIRVMDRERRRIRVQINAECKHQHGSDPYKAMREMAETT